MSLIVLENGIEILHLSMSLATNTRDIFLFCAATELFIVCIPVLQCKLVGIIDGTFTLMNQADYSKLLRSVSSESKNR